MCCMVCIVKHIMYMYTHVCTKQDRASVAELKRLTTCLMGKLDMVAGRLKLEERFAAANT